MDERDDRDSTIYNTLLHFAPDGTLAARHRKLMPTGGERLVWGMGDGSTLQVVDTGFGRLGGLICWENYMPLARAALYAQGIDVYLAPTWDNSEVWVPTLRHIAREGRTYVIGVTSCISAADLPADLPGRDGLYGDDNDWLSRGNTTIIGPEGEILAGPLVGEEGVLYAEIDVTRARTSRQQFDPVGHYSRPDIFRSVRRHLTPPRGHRASKSPEEPIMKTSSARPNRAGQPRGVLVDAEWLDAHLHDPAVRVVEVDVSRRAHDEWHIDGAVLWDVYRDLKDADYRLIGTAATERLLARSGIGPGSTVVFYGYAPALGFWLMKLYGHQDVRVLDCSRDAWRDEGHPVSSQPSEPAAAGYVLPGPDPRLRAGHAAVRDAIGRPGSTLLDVRSWDEYRGERFWPSGGLEPGGRAGHVPSAVHQPIDGLYDERGAFLDAAALRGVFSATDLDGAGRADHVLHDRRPRLHRLVRPDLPARPRQRPGLRRLVGRMGPDGRGSGGAGLTAYRPVPGRLPEVDMSVP